MKDREIYNVQRLYDFALKKKNYNEASGHAENIALHYGSKGMYKEALKYHLKEKECYSAMRDESNLARVLCKIAEINVDLRNYSEAKENLRKCMEIAKKNGDLVNKERAHKNYSYLWFSKFTTVERDKEILEKCIKFNQTCVNQLHPKMENMPDIEQDELNEMKGRAQENLSYFYLLSGDSLTSYNHFKKAEEHFHDCQDDKNLIRLYIKTADYLLGQVNFSKFQKRQRELIDKATNLCRSKNDDFVDARIIKAKGLILTRNFFDAKSCLIDAYDENNKNVKLQNYLKILIAIEKRTCAILKGEKNVAKNYEDIADILNYFNDFEYNLNAWEVRNFNLLIISYYKMSIEEIGESSDDSKLANLYFSIAECYKEEHVEMYKEAIENYEAALKLAETNPKEQANFMEELIKCMILMRAKPNMIIEKFKIFLNISKGVSKKQYQKALKLTEYQTFLKEEQELGELKAIRSEIEELGEVCSDDEDCDSEASQLDLLGNIVIETAERRQKRALSKTVNDKGEYPLNVVVKEDRAEKKIEQLLRLGEPVEKRDGTGWTPLGDAMEKGILPYIKLLVNGGAQVNTRQPNRDATNLRKEEYKYTGDTPLILASCNQYLDVVEYLLEQGADPTLKNKEEKTALAYIRSHLKETEDEKDFGTVKRLKKIMSKMESKFEALGKDVDTKYARLLDNEEYEESSQPENGKKDVKILNKPLGFQHLKEETGKKQERRAMIQATQDTQAKSTYHGGVYLVDDTASSSQSAATQKKSRTIQTKLPNLTRNILESKSSSFSSLTQRSSVSHSNPSTPLHQGNQSLNSQQNRRSFPLESQGGQKRRPLSPIRSSNMADSQRVPQGNKYLKLTQDSSVSMDRLGYFKQQKLPFKSKPVSSSASKASPAASRLSSSSAKAPSSAPRMMNTVSRLNTDRRVSSRDHDDTVTSFAPGLSSTQIISDPPSGRVSQVLNKVVSDDELPDIPDNARIDNNYENTEDKKRQRSRSPSLSSLDSWGARSPSPKPRTPIPSSAADIYRETIQGLRAFKPQEKPVVEELSPTKSSSQQPESAEILSDDDWLVDDIGEQLTTKKSKKNNQYIRETRSPDRPYSPQRGSSPTGSQLRSSSPSRSSVRRTSPYKSPARHISPLRSPERSSFPIRRIDSPVLNSQISSPSKDMDSSLGGRVSSPLYPRSGSPVMDQSWGSRPSKLKKRRDNNSLDESTTSTAPVKFMENQQARVISETISDSTMRSISPILNESTINVSQILHDTTVKVSKMPAVGRIKVKVQGRLLVVPVHEDSTVEEFSKMVSARYDGSRTQLSLSTDEGAELYKCDRLLDVVSLQDTLVASPVATSIQPPHVRFQDICRNQNIEPPKNIIKPLERIAEKEKLVINQPLKQDTFANVFQAIEGYFQLQELDLKYCKLGRDAIPLHLHKVFQSLVHLQSLDLSNNHLNTATLDMMAPLPKNLTSLDLSDNQLQSSNLMTLGKVLNSCTGLGKLRLSNVRLNKAMLKNSQEGCEHFQQALKGLSELDISNNNELEAQGLELLLKMVPKSLDKLDISNFIKEVDPECLKGLVTYCKTDQQLKGVELQDLCMRDCKLSGRNMHDLDKIILRLENIKKLDLSKNNFTGGDIAQLLSKIIECEVHLTHLKLEDCSQLFSSGEEEFMDKLDEFMNSGQKMRYLSLPGHNEETEARLTKIWKSSWSADAVVQNNDENIIFKVIGD